MELGRINHQINHPYTVYTNYTVMCNVHTQYLKLVIINNVNSYHTTTKNFIYEEQICRFTNTHLISLLPLTLPHGHDLK